MRQPQDATQPHDAAGSEPTEVMTETLMTTPSSHLSAPAPLLEISGLTVEFPTEERLVTAVAAADLTIRENQVHCLVGESGSGKSQTARAALGLLDPPGRVAGGQMLFHQSDGQVLDLADLKPRGRRMRHIRGGEIGMIFQEPARSLSPLHTVGFQIAEAMRLHRGLTKKESWEAAVEALRAVRIPRSELRAKSYPFELSGGMRQRAMIAIALAGQPRLLIADEPTTALDVTTQAQILDLLREIQAERDMAILFITHDLGVVAEMADEVSVMRRGEVVEHREVHDLFAAAEHSYTQMLLKATPKLRVPTERPGSPPLAPFRSVGTNAHSSTGFGAITSASVATVRGSATTTAAADAAKPLVEVRNLTRSFILKSGALGLQRNQLRAVDGVDLDIYAGETLGLVGESGCGKSTLAKCLLRVEKPTGGTVLQRLTTHVTGDVAAVPERQLREYRRQMRMVFQDPFASLNPRMTVRDILLEPVRGDGPISDNWLVELLELVGLESEHLERYPHAFSGGQRQRIGIARAIATDPQVLVADEAVSALDVSVRAQVLDLMARLQAERGLSYLFISHDMSTVEHLSDRVAVMYLGKLVETAPTAELFTRPMHPYTETLLSAVPIADPVRQRGRARIEISGELPDPTEKPSGCPFRSRCRFAQEICATETPPLRGTGEGRQTACHFAEQLQLTGILR
ncbi:dipeptide ABC transporter ATP-binding protein [Nesterenkonia ebinurensis]|uniref:dipeptide ABC transporter ATP-binding protein n=1 Tax=Nesterenkonia ebinurensis TaxID=2608252 RepID=UPI001CC428EB|nr:ABC transporter ATP-binding protein [Nesterenkonia ebinurensis]